MTFATVLLVVIILFVLRKPVKRIINSVDVYVDQAVVTNTVEAEKEFKERMKKLLEEREQEEDKRDFYQLYEAYKNVGKNK